MNRLAALTLLVALVSTPLACRRHKIRAQQTDEDPSAPGGASLVRMGDAKAAWQLVSGFYGIEAGTWRWTARRFSISLKPPAGAAEKGATLEMKLTIPPITVQKLQSVTLTASIGGTTFPSETYSQEGVFTFKRDVPAGLLTGSTARVDFQLDKAIPPGDTDLRELGIVATSVALSPK